MTDAAGLAGVLPMLVCPHCCGALTAAESGVVGCRQGHRFDVARQGYLSLLGPGSRTDTGDSADMVAARREFLAAGHYLPIARAVAERVDAGPVVEVGAGPGYYLGHVLDELASRGADPRGVALDSSRYAARRAAAHPQIGSVVADAWSRLPIADAAAPTVLSIFAPRLAGEFTRILAPGGKLVVVTPHPDHLAEIRGTLGMLTIDQGKPERLASAFDGMLSPAGRTDLRRELRLSRPDLSALVRMGPSARHVDPGALAAGLQTLDDVTPVTLAVTVSVLERR